MVPNNSIEEQILSQTLGIRTEQILRSRAIKHNELRTWTLKSPEKMFEWRLRLILRANSSGQTDAMMILEKSKEVVAKLANTIIIVG